MTDRQEKTVEEVEIGMLEARFNNVSQGLEDKRCMEGNGYYCPNSGDWDEYWYSVSMG